MNTWPMWPHNKCDLDKEHCGIYFIAFKRWKHKSKVFLHWSVAVEVFCEPGVGLQSWIRWWSHLWERVWCSCHTPGLRAGVALWHEPFPRDLLSPCAGHAQPPLPASCYRCNFESEGANRVSNGYITLFSRWLSLQSRPEWNSKFLPCFLNLISRIKLWAMMQEKAAGPAVLVAIAFLFRLGFPFGRARLFLPFSGRGAPVGCLVKEFPRCLGEGWQEVQMLVPATQSCSHTLGSTKIPGFVSVAWLQFLSLWVGLASPRMEMGSDFDTDLCSQLNRLCSWHLLEPWIPPGLLGCVTTVKGAPWKQLFLNSGKLFLNKNPAFSVGIFFVSPKPNPFSYFSVFICKQFELIFSKERFLAWRTAVFLKWERL